MQGDGLEFLEFDFRFRKKPNNYALWISDKFNGEYFKIRSR